MSRISPVFLSRVVSLLSRAAKGERSDLTRSDGREIELGKANKQEELKLALRKRLNDLCKSGEDIYTQGPKILVQEIVIWEFGGAIVESESFEAMIDSVTKALTANPDTCDAVARLIRQYSE